MSEVWRIWRHALELQLGRRALAFALADVALLLWVIQVALLGNVSGGLPRALYPLVVFAPLLLLGVPALADVVALEREAGCLDLALSAPSVEGYFLRRVTAVGAVLVAQGWIVMTLFWLLDGFSFALPVVLAQVAAATAFVVAGTLFWAVRLRGAGTVWIGSLATFALCGKWLFYVPVPPRLGDHGGPFLPGALEALEWSGSFAVLLAGTTLFLLYARRRLRRPESMI